MSTDDLISRIDRCLDENEVRHVWLPTFVDVSNSPTVAVCVPEERDDRRWWRRALGRLRGR